MPDLMGLITAALRDPGNIPWLPGLATKLVDRGWEDLYYDTGLTPSEYGTERVLARDRNVPRKIVSMIPAALSYRDSAQAFQIELLGRDAARRYEESGVKFYSEDEINRGRMTERVVEAVTILKSIPTLFTAVAELVRSIHLIDAGDDDYDASFSEPHLPFSIFVSVQRNPSKASVLRAVEAIVHEAMHLQLTLIERTVALTRPAGGMYFSPWRQEYRDVRGILHALYVFQVIDRLLEKIAAGDNEYGTEGYEHLQSRRNEISKQVRAVKSFQDCPELTRLGADFVKYLVQDV
jgi:HEXXH motif-containing protein